MAGSTATRTPTAGAATPTRTATPSGGTGSVHYNWETAGSTEGWQRGWGIVGTVAQSTARAHLGTGALRLPVIFSGAGYKDGGALVYPSPPAEWSALGSTPSLWVYLPSTG